jgi:hypothetical protein
LFYGLKRYFAAFFYGNAIGSADRAGNKLVLSYWVKLEAFMAFGATEQYRG